MRTTLTLDEDVAARLKSIARRSGLAFRQVVNDTLRRGLAQRPAAAERQPFRVAVRDLGQLTPGLSLDNVGELMEPIEGPWRRSPSNTARRSARPTAISRDSPACGGSTR